MLKYSSIYEANYAMELKQITLFFEMVYVTIVLV